MAIKQYSLAKDGARQLAPGFKVREFRCRDGSDAIMIDQTLVVLLQAIREHFNKPITITSGYRTAAHNAAVGGAKSSQHLLGRAAWTTRPSSGSGWAMHPTTGRPCISFCATRATISRSWTPVVCSSAVRPGGSTACSGSG